MLIYCYADILGYRNLLKTHSADCVHKILDDSFAEMHRAIRSMEESIFKGEEIKTYIAFDTIVIYWENFKCNRDDFRLFLLAIDIIYLILYDKGILVRGAIGASCDYYIGKDRIENNVAYFIIDNIEAAALIEKEQNWSSIIVFGKDLINLSYGCGALLDDYFERLEYYNNKDRNIKNKRQWEERRTVPLKRDAKKLTIADYALRDEGVIKAVNLLDRRNCFILICPFNRFCYRYFGDEFYTHLKEKLEDVIDEGMGKRDHDHAKELRYRTAKHLMARLSTYEYGLKMKNEVFGDLYPPEPGEEPSQKRISGKSRNARLS